MKRGNIDDVAMHLTYADVIAQAIQADPSFYLAVGNAKAKDVIEVRVTIGVQVPKAAVAEVAKRMKLPPLE